jgi:uncharacterized coiled-coil DUF342 family protein
MKQLSLAQQKKIKECAERIICFYADIEEIMKNIKEMEKILQDNRDQLHSPCV